MIQLRNNPIEGSSVKLGLSFRDSLGKYYIPVYVTYTFLALNNDNESWSVVDDLYKVPLTPASTINLLISNIKTITNTTLERKVVINYQAYIDNEYADFVDEINFTIQPQPTISGSVPTPPEPETYIKVLSCDLIAGSLVAAPILPVFKLKTNMPSYSDDVVGTIINTETLEEISCTVTPDLTGTVFNISSNKSLERTTNYKLRVVGLKSKAGDYPLENPFELNFTTLSGDPKIQDEKEVTITANGTEEVLPDGESEGIAKVIVHTEIPLEEIITREYDANGTYQITPSDGYTAIFGANVVINIPLQDEKNISLTNNGEYEIVPDDENTAMKKVNVTVDLSGTVQTDKEETITSNGDTTILPDSPFATMDKVVVHTEIPLESDKVETITANGTTTILPSSGYDGMTKVQVETAIPLEEEMDVSTSSDGVLNITPSDGYTAMKKVVVTVNTGGSKALYAYDGDNDMKFYLTRIIGSTGNYTVLPDPVVSAYEGFNTYHIIKVGSEIQITYKGTDVMLTRNSSEDIMRE